MGFGWDQGRDNYQQTYNDNGQPQPEHDGSLTHEILAGGAAFAGFKAYEDHQRANGQQVSHQFAKEMLAGFAGAEADKLVETKGEDFYDKEKVRYQAKQNADQLYDQHYGGQDQYNPNDQRPHRHMQEQFQGQNNW